jgi:GH25 family lysozyme M1 (1,4-beta-N-acetylmuramidase)
MAGLDLVTATDSTQTAIHGTATSTILSLEANGGPGKPGDPRSGTSRDRGHAAHAGHDHSNQIEPPPTQSLPTHHTISGTTAGIDVSEFQNNIDWQQVQKAGVQFAFIRATDGTTIQDADFVKNWQGAEKAGVLVGPYHYFTTTSPVQSQITNFVSTLKQVDTGNLPPVLDVEDASQFAKYTIPQRVTMVQQWLDGVQQEVGVQPMLYMSPNFSAAVLGNAPQFDKYRLWVADDTSAAQPIIPKPWTNWNFWQHADNGQIPGIAGGVDLDYFNGPTSMLPVTKPTQPVTKPMQPLTPVP